MNAHGALLYSDQDLEIGSRPVLTNFSTQEEQECRVLDWVPAQTNSAQKN
jgi:hypothetical protein